MKVFIVFEKYDPYDQDEIVGVYADEHKAEEVYGESPDYRVVVAVEVQ